MNALSQKEFDTLLFKVNEMSLNCVQSTDTPCPCETDLQSFLAQQSDDIPFAEIYKTLKKSRNCKKIDGTCDASQHLFLLSELAAKQHVKGKRA